MFTLITMNADHSSDSYQPVKCAQCNLFSISYKLSKRYGRTANTDFLLEFKDNELKSNDPLTNWNQP